MYFSQQQITYLGHIISKDGVSTDPTKIEAVLKWLVQQSFTELRGFLDLIGYYGKFVKNYGIIARPLTNLLHHKAFSLSNTAQSAFDKLK
jgi:hypothetical protein